MFLFSKIECDLRPRPEPCISEKARFFLALQVGPGKNKTFVSAVNELVQRSAINSRCLTRIQPFTFCLFYEPAKLFETLTGSARSAPSYEFWQKTQRFPLCNIPILRWRARLKKKIVAKCSLILQVSFTEFVAFSVFGTNSKTRFIVWDMSKWKVNDLEIK